MRFYSGFLLYLLAFFGGSGIAFAGNDFPGTAITGINTIQASALGNNTAATGQPPDEPLTIGGGNLNTLWFSWTAPGNGTATFQTCGTNTQTNYDTVLQSFTGGTLAGLTLLASNDDTAGCAAGGVSNRGSRITFPVTNGTVYRIQLDGWNSSTGTLARLQYNFTGFTIAKSASVASVSAPSTITYTITVANTGYVALTGPALTDALLLNASSRTLTSGPTLVSGDADSDGQVDTTETWTYTATYAVPQTDIDTGGTFSNTATLDTNQTDAFASSAATTSITQTQSIEIVKSWLFANPAHDLNSNGQADLNDIITYRYDVQNNGNVTLTSVTVSDAHGGSDPAPTPDNEAILIDTAPASDSTDATASNELWSTLAPNDTVRFVGTYTVTQTDFDNQ